MVPRPHLLEVGVVPQETWWLDLVVANGRYWTAVWNRNAADMETAGIVDAADAAFDAAGP